MQTQTLKFPQAGWLGQRIRPAQRLRTAVSKLRSVTPQKAKAATREQLQALQKRFAKQ